MHLRKSLVAAAAVAFALTASSCAAPSSSPSGSAAGTPVKIGITQIVSHPSLNASVEGFKEALADAGYDATYDEQNAQGDVQTAATIAGNFATADLDLVLAVATPTAQAAAQAITDKPVLFTAVTDPVGAGLVKSLKDPGGNVTGTTDAPPVEDGDNPATKQMSLIKQIVPDAKTVGIVYSSGEANSLTQVKWAKEAAKSMDLEIKEATVTTSAEVQQAAESLSVDAYYVITDNTVVSALDSLLTVAESKKVPTIAAEGNSVADGCVGSWGISYHDLGYQTGEMAAKVLAGEADPASTPVEDAKNLELYLNLAAAKKQGVTIPQSVIDEADPENVTK